MGIVRAPMQAPEYPPAGQPLSLGLLLARLRSSQGVRAGDTVKMGEQFVRWSHAGQGWLPIVDAELELGGFGHAAFVPGRVPDHIHLGGGHARQLHNLALNFRRQRAGGGTGRCGQRHANGDGAHRINEDVVNQAKLDVGWRVIRCLLQDIGDFLFGFGGLAARAQ